MGKQSRLKRERREAKLRGETTQQEQDLRILDNVEVVPADVAVAYLVTKFIGKAGYKYISIGRYGSLFMNDNSASIVAVNLHREFPVTSVRGRYNDPQRRDIAVNSFHVPGDFPGIVVDRKANVYIGGSEQIATKEEVDHVLTNFQKVTAQEYNDALKAEQPIFEEQVKKMKEKMQQTEEEIKQSLEADMPTPYTEDTVDTEVITPEVEAEITSAPLMSDTPIQDAEVIQ